MAEPASEHAASTGRRPGAVAVAVTGLPPGVSHDLAAERPVASSIASAAFGVLCGTWLLAVLLTTGNHLEDLLVAVPLALLWWAHARSDPETGRGDRRVSIYAGVLAGWWLVCWAHGVAAGVPPVQALSFGRDFLYFALLLPVLPGFVARHRAGLRPAALVLGLGAAAYTVAQLLASAGLVDVGSLLHAKTALTSHGLVRIYSPMNYLVQLALLASVAAAWLAERLAERCFAALCALLFAAGVLVQQTRAAYIAVVAALVVGTLLWRSREAASWTAPGRRVARTVVVVAAILVAFALLAPSVASSVWQRASSAFTDLFHNSGDVGTRLQIDRQMLSILGWHWPFGLGFLNSATRNFGTLPNGSIRDTDLGVMNALMTMGAIGTVLMYLPLLRSIRVALPRYRQRQGGPLAEAERGSEWWRFGCVLFLLAVVFGSLSLVVLFSVPGVVLVATVIAFLTATPRPGIDSETAQHLAVAAGGQPSSSRRRPGVAVSARSAPQLPMDPPHQLE